MYLKGNRLNTRLVAVQIIQHFQRKSLLFCPTAIHTIKHSCPITGFRSACACIQLHDSVILIVFSRKQRFHTDTLKIRLKLVKDFLNLFDNGRIIFLISHLDQRFHILHLAFQIFVSLFIILETFQFFHHFLGAFRVIPEIRLLHFSF